MEETYTYDALVQLLYREMPASEAAGLSDLIDEDEQLNAAFHSLLIAKTQLPKALFNPSQAAVNNILQYSARTTLEAYS
jgi:hypothetical protein